MLVGIGVVRWHKLAHHFDNGIDFTINLRQVAVDLRLDLRVQSHRGLTDLGACGLSHLSA